MMVLEQGCTRMERFFMDLPFKVSGASWTLARQMWLWNAALPQICEKQQGQFPVQASNPFMSDVIVQSLLIWTQKYYQAPCLPSNLASLEQYKVIPFDETCLVDLQIVTHNEYAVVADIWVTNRQGDVYMKFNGLEGTISTSLKRLLSVSILENSFENIDE